MTGEALALFEPEAIPRWVVEVDEVKLNAIGGPGAQWWARRAMAPFEAWRRRLTIVAVTVPGALVYIDCGTEERAVEWREHMVENGCHPKAVTVRRLGRLITCKGCGERRPFWATSRRIGQRCRPCWDAATQLGWPGGSPAGEVGGRLRPGPG